MYCIRAVPLYTRRFGGLMSLMPSQNERRTIEDGVTENTVRIVIVDDQPIVSFALAHVLSSRPGWTVVAQVATTDEARGIVQRSRPDIVVVDLRCPDADSLEFLCWVGLESDNARSIVYSLQPAAIYARKCIQAGASAYIGKESTVEDVIETVRLVSLGHTVVCGNVCDSECADFLKSSQGIGIESLSRREIEVLNLIGQGMSNKAIARFLCRSDKTVESHRYRIARKLRVENGPALVELARRYHATGSIDQAPTATAAASVRSGQPEGWGA